MKFFHLFPSQMPKVPPPPPKKKQAPSSHSPPASPLSQSNQTSVVDFDPDHYVLVLKGTDEVLAGDTPLEHFYYIRQFLFTNNRILQVLLENKDIIINQIKSKEMNDSIKTEEPDAALLFKPVLPKIHENLNKDDLSSKIIGCIPHSLIKEPLCIYIKGTFNIPHTKYIHKYFINILLVNRTDILCSPDLINEEI